jgi:hypothetical protein
MLNQPTETELTRAARQSISNVDQISEGDTEFHEEDFGSKKAAADKKAATDADARKKARKAERQRKAKGRKRK